MLEVQFLEDTYIRRDLNSMVHTEMGYIHSGESIFVKPDPLKGVTRTHRIKGITVTSDLWYTCLNGWYYWYGSTDIGYRDLLVKSQKLIKEAQLKLSDVPWETISFDPQKMSKAISTYNLTSEFWKFKKLGTGVKLAILDRGFKAHFDILDDAHKFNITNESNKRNFIDSSNHGGKSIALAKYLSEKYYGLCPGVDLYFYKIQYAFTPTIDQIIKNIISAIDDCTEKNIEIINLSWAVHPSSLIDKDLIPKLNKAIDRFCQKGLFICASGNSDHLNGNQKGEELIPGSFQSTVCIGSYLMENSNKIPNSLTHENVDYYLQSHDLKLPYFEKYNNSSSATVLFSSIMALMKSKYSSTNAKLKKVIKKDSLTNKYFSISQFIQNLNS